MLNKRIICFVIASLMLAISISFAEQQEFKEYTVQKGDTLWGISNKELQDPFLWPKVWKENPQIDNPDWLTPGQIIKIPLYLLRGYKEEKKETTAPVESVPKKETIKEEVQKAPEVKQQPKPLVDMNLYAASGYIMAEVTGLGEVTGAPSGRTIFGNNDFIYVNTKDNAKVGDKFVVLRKGQLIKHPVTKDSVGYVVEMLGIVEINRFEYGQTVAKITKIFDDIGIGDMLDTYNESDMKAPVVLPPFRKPAIDGYVIGAKHFRLNNGTFDIVYLDKGKKDGLAVGDILRTVAVGKHKVPNGKVQIIRTLDTVSSAIIREALDAIEPGNLITQAE